MSSVYCPSHVFIIFRRLVNVVSTLSISKHCISYAVYPHPDHGDNVNPTQEEILSCLRDSTQRLEPLAAHDTVEHSQSWPLVMIRQTWDKALGGTICEIQDMRNSLYLQDPGGGIDPLVFFRKYSSMRLLQLPQHRTFRIGFLRNGRGLGLACFHHSHHLRQTQKLSQHHLGHYPVLQHPKQVKRRKDHSTNHPRKKSRQSASRYPPQTNSSRQTLSTSFLPIQHFTTQ